MQPKALLVLSFALGLVSAQDYLDFEQGDFPPQCADPCSMIATAEETCDNQNDDDDQAQLNCVCNTQNMAAMIPDCLACLADYRVGVDDDNNNNDRSYEEEYRDLSSLISACSFTAPSISVAPLSSTVYTTTVTETDDDGEVDTDTDEVTSYFTGSPTGGAAAPETTAVTTTDDNGSTTVVSTTISPSPTNGNSDSSNQDSSSSSPNAAPAITAAPLAAAGILAAMVAL